MRLFVFGLLILINNINCFSQNCCHAGDQETEAAKWKYFEKYKVTGVDTSAMQKCIVNNWKQYFQQDIMKEISKYDYYPLMLDSYGSPYANQSLFKGANDEFFSGGVRLDANLQKYSMYKIFNSEANQQQLKTNLETLPEGNDKAFYKRLLSNPISNIDMFYATYDNYHTNLAINNIKEKLGSRKKVVFFIHGYNVPYSLACVQADALLDILSSNNFAKPNEDFLFIPIFWSSNDAKAKDVISQDNFSTKNEENQKNGRKFWFYSNRAYYAAFKLRKIINQLPKDIEILVFSHSLGTTIATTAFINTSSKLDFPLKDFFVNKHCSIPILKDPKQFDKKSDDVTKDFVNEMMTEPLPSQEARIFLSAAAIPGENTFRDMDSCSMLNKKWYVGINYCDVMLSKNVARRKFFLIKLLVHPTNFSATTLGLDYKRKNDHQGEIEKTKILFDDPKNFITNIVSDNEDHEIFTYMNQDRYIQLIRKWYAGN